MNTGRDLAYHFSENIQLLDGLFARYREVFDSVNDAVEQVERDLKQALEDLSAEYLPELSPAAIQDLVARTSFKKLQRQDPLKAMEHERVVLRKTIAQIEQDERYQRRQWLVGSNGELTRDLEEARSMLAPWEEACAKFESLKHFTTLVELGYDTPDYKVGWLERRYWTYWAAGDAICTALGMSDFGDHVLPAWRKVEPERRKWREQVAEIEERIALVHDLVRRHDIALALIPQLPEKYLQASREAIAEFVRVADPQLLATWNQQASRPDRAVTLGLRRVAGLRAKQDALLELRDRGLQPFMSQLGERRSKYHRKANKFRRPKHRSSQHSSRNFDHKFRQKLPKYEQRAEQAGAMVERILGYEEYERFDLANNEPELWFREMTGKRPPRLFPQLRGWYDRNPQHRPARSKVKKASERRLATAAVTTSTRDDLGYLS